jgi:ferredoxin--NADP+ reductase
MKKYKIAIVGAGPAGYFTAQALQNLQTNDLTFAIDMIEKLPTPWGLVRSGVAPDHQKIKTVSKVFEKIAKAPNFRLFANVEVGKDVSVKDLKEQYDAVVLATGAAKGRRLGIPGEELENSISAADFVPWYNAHPDYADLNLDLSCDTAIVIGAGNVAMDVARILAIDPTELDSTDIADHALLALKQSKIRTVIVCGRRGPEHAAFTALELRDLLKLINTDVYIDLEQVNSAMIRNAQIIDTEKELRNILETMKLIAEHPKKGVSRKIEIKFLALPLEIKGKGKVSEVVFAVNKVIGKNVITTDKTFSIQASLVVTAIGYDAIEYPGIKVKNGRITNIAGHVEHNLYTTGWAKRGPIGVIGTNKSDSKDVVDLLVENLKAPKVSEGITALLKPTHEVINQTSWEKINAEEIISGQIFNKPRLKIPNRLKLIQTGRKKLT